MDYPLSIKDLRNERRRQRYATVLTGEGRSRGATSRDTYVPSIGSVNGSVDCNYGKSVPVLLPVVSPSCSGCELLSDVSLDSVLVNDFPAAFISSNVHNNLPRTSSISLHCQSETGESSASVSLGSTFELGESSASTFELGQSSASNFELGQSSAASVGPNVSFCYSGRAKPQTASSVCFGSNFQIGQTSLASVGQQHGAPVVSSPLPRARQRRRPVGRFDRISDVSIIQWDLPSSPYCLHCGALRFFRESPGFCCSNGQVCLPPPKVCPILQSLFTDMSMKLAVIYQSASGTNSQIVSSLKACDI